MTLFRLFWEFLKVGLFTFGGGYGAIPLIRDCVVANPWMGVDEDFFTYIIGVAESTPGPIMINTATYIGTTAAGPLGALTATLGAVTPSFVIILCIAKFLQGFLEKQGPRTVLDTVKPCVVGMILSTGIYFLVSGIIPQFRLFWTTGLTRELIPSWRTLLLFGLVFLLRFGWQIWKKKAIPPVLSIAIAAIFGILIYGV